MYASPFLPFAIITLTLLAILRKPLSSGTPYDVPEQQHAHYFQTPSPSPARDNWFEKLIATLAATVIVWHFITQMH